MTIHPPASLDADPLGWRRPLSATVAVLMLLVGPAAVGVATPTDPGWPAPPTQQPVPPPDDMPSYKPALSGVECPQAAGLDSDPVGGCGPAGPAATPSPAPAATAPTTAPMTAPMTAGPVML